MTPSPPGRPTSSQRKLGILGGTFNPIHRCHLVLAREIRARLALDEILFIPTGDPPHKADGHLASAEHRLAMVRLAIEDVPGFDLSDIEIRRPGRSYSIDTLTALRKDLEADTELFFCIGLDAFLDFESWRQPDDLLRTCDFVVVSRPGTRFESLSTLTILSPLDLSRLQALDSGGIDQLSLPLPSGRSLHLLTITPCPVSASMIRTRIGQGLAVEGLLPPPVERYIIRAGLYQERTNPTRLEG
ncbi:putative nicotinate-nucleotide adenylyltransferase [Nitrospira sp.]|nr:putative nicotinate-nucleotide adenylyltransferase [Nitrospira sp.]